MSVNHSGRFIFLLLLFATYYPSSAAIDEAMILYDDRFDMVRLKLRCTTLDADFDGKRDSILIEQLLTLAKDETEVRNIDWGYLVYHSPTNSNEGSNFTMVDHYTQRVTLGDKNGVTGQSSTDIIRAEFDGEYRIDFSFAADSSEFYTSYHDNDFLVFNETQRFVYLRENNLENDYGAELDIKWLFVSFTLGVVQDDVSHSTELSSGIENFPINYLVLTIVGVGFLITLLI